jgi:lysophospholipase L1-like esterase
LRLAALAVGGPLVLLGLVELGLRVGGYRFDPWAAFAGAQRFVQLGEAHIFTPDRELLWTLRRGTVIDIPEAGFPRVRTNSGGFRGAESPARKTHGELLVLCLGDSVTFGLGLDDRETWPARLAATLRAAPELAGRPVQVINGAVPGWSSIQGMRLLTRMKEVEPDVVVFWFGLNDAKEARGVPDSEFVPPSVAATETIRILRKLRIFQLLQELMVGTPRVAPDLRRVSPSEFRDAVQRLLAGARSGGPAPLFVRYPEWSAQTISELATVVARAEEAGATLVIGHHRLLSAAVPAREGTDLTGREVRTPEGRAILFKDGPADTTRTLAAVKKDLVRLQALKRGLDELLVALPENSLGYEDLFGDAAPAWVFTDICHLNPHGADLAGRALARAVLQIVREER